MSVVLSVVAFKMKVGRLSVFVFFFSSRRRHTRFDCDWSSDVCSSDLLSLIPHLGNRIATLETVNDTVWKPVASKWYPRVLEGGRLTKSGLTRYVHLKIGRASCRERV